MNAAEQRLAAGLESKGLIVHRNGWPDFLVANPERTQGFALELKCGKDRLRPEQVAMHHTLESFGVPVFTVREDFITALDRRGRKILLPHTIATLKSRVEQLRLDAAILTQELQRTDEQLDLVTILFDDAPIVDPHQRVPDPVA